MLLVFALEDAGRGRANHFKIKNIFLEKNRKSGVLEYHPFPHQVLDGTVLDFLKTTFFTCVVPEPVPVSDIVLNEF